MRLKLFLFILILIGGGFALLSFQDVPVTPQKTEVTLPREKFIP